MAVDTADLGDDFWDEGGFAGEVEEVHSPVRSTTLRSVSDQLMPIGGRNADDARYVGGCT